jgi:hypothetical protein
MLSNDTPYRASKVQQHAIVSDLLTKIDADWAASLVSARARFGAF